MAEHWNVRHSSAHRAAAVAGLAALALSPLVSTGATADPGVDDPWYYMPSDASLTDTPTYLSDRAQQNADGSRTNGQDYDHYCVADWQAVSILPANHGNGLFPMYVNSPTSPFMQGINGILFPNQYWDTDTQPGFRIVWATNFATTNSVLTLTFSDNLTLRETSTPPAVELIPGASRFRSIDWSTYTLGRVTTEPWLSSTEYIEGPYTGLNTDIFTVNPNPNPAPIIWNAGLESWKPNGFTDLYWPEANQYVADPAWMAENITWTDPHTLTINLGDQPADALIAVTVRMDSSDTSRGATMTANFTADYVETNAANTVCYPVSVEWDKIDTATGALLPGAVFSLTATGGTANVAATTAINATDNAGAFDADSSHGLEPGTWQLAETQAPDGYSSLPSPQNITLSFEQPHVDLGQIANSLNTPPTINGENLTVTQGDTSVSALTGMTTTDAEDGDLTSSIVIVDDGGFDISTEGTYTVTYSVTDAGGLTTTHTRTIVVTSAPVVTPPAPPSPTPVTPSPELARTGMNSSGLATAGLVFLALGGIPLALRARKTRTW